jgi:hypothetical protein
MHIVEVKISPHPYRSNEMASKFLTSFEVLANPIAPGIADVPYVQQGFFLQISNISAGSALVGLEFVSSPAFVSSSGAVKLFTNIIDQAGMPQQYPSASFLGAPVGFESLIIPGGATWLVGVQYLLIPPPPPAFNATTGTTPQDAMMARGMVKVEAQSGTQLLMQATTRQVFTNYDATGAVTDYDATAYPMDLIGGPLQVF